jgi:hypothetical protein
MIVAMPSRLVYVGVALDRSRPPYPAEFKAEAVELYRSSCRSIVKDVGFGLRLFG